MSFYLQYYENGQQHQVSVQSQLSIGSSSDADVVFNHPTVSRRHALIGLNASGATLTVISTDGLTAVNGQPVSGEVPIFDGDQLHIGVVPITVFGLAAQNNYRALDDPTEDEFPRPPSNAYESLEEPTEDELVVDDATREDLAVLPNDFVQRAAYDQPGGAYEASTTPRAPAAGFNANEPGNGWDTPGWDVEATPPPRQQPQNPPIANPPSGGFKPNAGYARNQPARGYQQQNQIPSGPLPAAVGANLGNPVTPGTGIESWDSIAESASKADAAEQKEATNFERLQEAQKLADKKSKGTSPVAIGLVGVLAIGTMFWMFSGPSVEPIPIELPDTDGEQIRFLPGDIKCSVPADCRAKSVKAYKVAKQTFEEKNTRVDNIYQAYKLTVESRLYLHEAEVDGKLPEIPELDGREELEEKSLQDLREQFKGYQIKFTSFQKRKMYDEMAETLEAMKTVFPDRRHVHHQWAVDQERNMRDRGIHPN